MSFFNKIFSRKEEKQIETYQDFWDWFLQQEKDFFKVVKKGGSNQITNKFFDKIAPMLDQLKEGIWYLTGMLDEDTVDLILTADGDIKNFYLIEELIAAAPELKGWKFRAHKAELDIENVGIEMAGFSFTNDNISFYSNDIKEYPDEIDITIIHDDYNEENKEDIINGTYIFMDNYLGELNSLTIIDNITFKSKEEIKEELIPIEKLKSFINWRQKEFVEKYEGIRRNRDEDSYGSLEATLENGNKLLAVVNTDVLNWDAKASHPWILRLELKYEVKRSDGFPDEDMYQLLNEIEEEFNLELKDFEGYLNIGRETTNGLREVHFACKDYRKPCKMADDIIKKYSNKLVVNYEIYKDKYWRSFEKFQS